MSFDEERWDELGGAWRTETAERPEWRRIGARVRRQTLGMWLVAGLEAALTLVLLWWSVELVRAGVDLFETALVATLWAFWVIAAVFAYGNRRGAWRAAGESTRAYLEIALDRARRRRRTARFVVWLLAAEVVAFLALLAWRATISPLATGTVFGALALLAALSAVYLAWSIWTRRRAGREIETLSRVLEELERAEKESGRSGL